MAYGASPVEIMWFGIVGWWVGHLPYIEIRGDEIVAGYICSQASDRSVIVFKISRRGSSGTMVYK
jgi:hypothetical protein